MLLWIAVCFCGCQGCDSAKSGFSIVWNYDTGGELMPCGCSAHQLGGLERRATLIDAERQRRDVLLLDGGHILAGTGSFQLFKGKIIIKALNEMGCDGMMLGICEAAQGSSGIQALSELADFPLFSANLMVDGLPWSTAYGLADIGGQTVGFTGVSQLVAHDVVFAEGTSFKPPEDCLAVALTELAEVAQLIIVCLEGETVWVERMSREFADRADLILAGDRSQDAQEAALAAAALSDSTEQLEFELPNLAFQQDPPRINTWGLGRYTAIVEAQPGWGGYRFSGRNVALDESLANAARITAIIEEDYKPELHRYYRDYTDELVQDYIPPEQCGGCHVEQYQTFIASAHAGSMDELIRVGRLYDPDCIRCHLVYEESEDELHALNCIVCHSNITRLHEWQAWDDMVIRPAEPVTEYSYEWCVRCHDADNSLPFRSAWPQYVSHIYHGGDASLAEREAEWLGIDLGQGLNPTNP